MPKKNGTPSKNAHQNDGAKKRHAHGAKFGHTPSKNKHGHGANAGLGHVPAINEHGHVANAKFGRHIPSKNVFGNGVKHGHVHPVAAPLKGRVAGVHGHAANLYAHTRGHNISPTHMANKKGHHHPPGHVPPTSPHPKHLAGVSSPKNAVHHGAHLATPSKKHGGHGHHVHGLTPMAKLGNSISLPILRSGSHAMKDATQATHSAPASPSSTSHGQQPEHGEAQPEVAINGSHGHIIVPPSLDMFDGHEKHLHEDHNREADTDLPFSPIKMQIPAAPPAPIPLSMHSKHHGHHGHHQVIIMAKNLNFLN